MTRARFVWGDAALRRQFDEVRRQVITAVRDAPALRGEIVAMREKVRAAHPIRGQEVFDLKHSPGGMVDVEFVVQYLVLSQAASHPALADNVGNIALLERAEQAGLLLPGVGHASADAYRELRRLQHRARLNEEPTHKPVGEVQSLRQPVLELWGQVLG